MRTSFSSFLRYYSLVLSRASKDTMASLGWRPAHVIFPVLVVLGFIGLVWFKGLKFAQDEIVSAIFITFGPAGIFAFLMFAFQLVMAPVRIWREGRPETASLATEIAAFYFGGEQIRQNILDAGEDADPDATYLLEISKWTEKVGHWLLVNDSPASMMKFARSVTIESRVHHSYGGKHLSVPKEAAFQLIEEHLWRLGEIMEHHWGAKK